jgi:C4-dicarboxylate-specific signal transduction histidine kinase
MDTRRMADSLTTSDYEKLTISELEAAARSDTAEARRSHLDQAGKFAALGEKSRGVAPTGR